MRDPAQVIRVKVMIVDDHLWKTRHTPGDGHGWDRAASIMPHQHGFKTYPGDQTACPCQEAINVLGVDQPRHDMDV